MEKLTYIDLNNKITIYTDDVIMVRQVHYYHRGVLILIDYM